MEQPESVPSPTQADEAVTPSAEERGAVSGSSAAPMPWSELCGLFPVLSAVLLVGVSIMQRGELTLGVYVLPVLFCGIMAGLLGLMRNLGLRRTLTGLAASMACAAAISVMTLSLGLARQAIWPPEPAPPVTCTPGEPCLGPTP